MSFFIYLQDHATFFSLCLYMDSSLNNLSFIHMTLMNRGEGHMARGQSRHKFLCKTLFDLQLFSLTMKHLSLGLF